MEAEAVQREFDDALAGKQELASIVIPPRIPDAPTLALQIAQLRDECRWTNEQLAEAADLSPRQVSRHTLGEAVPYKRTIAAYERIFSTQLQRKVVIEQKS
jgi:DNA-binding XRE family transcriptional regulator